MERKVYNQLKGKIVDLRKRTLALDEEHAEYISNMENVDKDVHREKQSEFVDKYVDIACDLDKVIGSISDKKFFSDMLEVIKEDGLGIPTSFIRKLYNKVDNKMQNLGQKKVYSPIKNGKTIRIG